MTVYDSDLLGWWSAAACAGYDPEWWSDDMRGRAQAVQICATCPVRLRCLEDAWERRDIGIIRGGALFRRVREGLAVTPLFCEECGEAPLPAAFTRKHSARRHTCEGTSRSDGHPIARKARRPAGVAAS